MTLPITTIEWVAKLANISLTDSEKQHYAQNLTGVVDYISELQTLDTETVTETMQITGLTDNLAADEVQNCEIPRDILLQSAGAVDKGLIQVKKVL